MRYTHTPGPWAFQDDQEHINYGYIVSNCRQDTHGKPLAIMTWIDREANARLIAAAPDLLDALYRALPYVEMAADDPGYNRDRVSAFAREIKSIIAKADGGDASARPTLA